MERVLAVGRGATPAEGICRGILEQGTEATNAPIGPSNELIHGGGSPVCDPLKSSSGREEGTIFRLCLNQQDVCQLNLI